MWLLCIIIKKEMTQLKRRPNLIFRLVKSGSRRECHTNWKSPISKLLTVTFLIQRYLTTTYGVHNWQTLFVIKLLYGYVDRTILFLEKSLNEFFIDTFINTFVFI